MESERPLGLIHSVIVQSLPVCRLSKESGGLSTASGLIQSILKEGEASKLSEEEQWRVCSILATAEYCMDTTCQLEEKLREKVDPALRASIDLSAEQDMFHT